MIKLVYPTDGCIIDTHTETQNTFIQMIKDKGIDEALEWLLPVKNDTECSHPTEIKFEWTNNGSDEYIFELSETEDFSDPIIFKTKENSIVITNLKIGQSYYWRVNGCDYTSFKTLDNEYRFIKIDGVLNVRDVGGIKIKQGLLYRGADVDHEYKISDKGVDTFVNELKIKTQMSLRKEHPEEPPFSVFSDKVNYKRLPYRPYTEIFYDEYRQGVKNIMEYLTDESHYPIYFHCAGGADRTGMIAMYLRALMGESEEELLIDYELTSLSTYAMGLIEGVRARGFRNRNNDYFVAFLDKIGYDKEQKNLVERIKAFLLECGVTDETVEKIRAIIAK